MKKLTKKLLCALLVVSMLLYGENGAITIKAEAVSLSSKQIDINNEESTPEYVVTVNQKVKNIYGDTKTAFKYIDSEKVNLSDSVVTYNSSNYESVSLMSIENSSVTGADFLNDCSSEYGFDSLVNNDNSVILQSFYKNILSALTEFYSNSTDVTSSNFGNKEKYCITSIEYQSQGLTTDEVKLVYEVVMFDHPLFYWLSNEIYYSEWYTYIIIDSSYASGVDRIDYNSEIENFISSYQSEVDECSSNYEIAKLLHDAIINRVTYAFDKDGNPAKDIYAHNIIGCVDDNIKKVTCEGYAKTYEALLNYYDIDNALATGWGVGSSVTKNTLNTHMWNVVKMSDNKYYYADLTWDDRCTEAGSNGVISYKYFLKGNSILDDHTLATSDDLANGYFSYKLHDVSDIDYDKANDLMVTQRDPIYNVYESEFWSISNGVLTVTGSGPMVAYRYTKDGQDYLVDTPWKNNMDSIKKIVIKNGITSIGSDSFAGCENLESIELPDSLVTIGNFAFLNCTKLDNVKLPSNLKSLGQQAFFNCSSLTKIVIPDSVNFIDAGVFGDCKSLSYAYIGRDVNDKFYLFSDGIFAGCESLENIQVSEDHDIFKSVDGVLMTKDGRILVQYPSGKKDENYKTLEGVVSIQQNAVVNNKYIKSFICSDGLEDVGAINFIMCDSLTYLEFPSTLTICEETFTFAQINRIVNKSNTPITLSDYTFAGEDSYGHSSTCYRYWKSLSTGNVIKVLKNDTAEAYYPVIAIAAPDHCEIKVGERKQIEVQCIPKKTNESDFNMVSNDNSIATVSDGCIVGVNNGTTKVIVTSTINSSVNKVIIVNVKAVNITPTDNAPSIPNVKAIVSSEKGVIKINWGRVSNINGYQIVYSTSSSFSSDKITKIIGSKELSKNITGLKSKKMYYIKMRAYKVVNGKKYYSSYSKVMSIKVK